MALRNSRPERFRPIGLADAFDQSESFRGACSNLQNLVFDQSNPGISVARPGVTRYVDFAAIGGWNTPGVISVHIDIGTRIYGMIDTQRFPGREEPFCYDTLTSAFVPISGVTVDNTPTTASTTGPWTPPTMDEVGAQIIVTHPGFDGGGNPPRFFGILDISNPAAPTWTCANTSVNALPSVPTGVAQYNNRAYFILHNALVFTDVLAPTVVTNANQVITLGDTSDITVLAPLGISTLTQGVLAALIAFKSAGQGIWQISGDAAFNNLSVQPLSNNIGCWAPRSAVNTPEGLKFLGIDGNYVVTISGQVVPLTNRPGQTNQDVKQPFIEALQGQASRAAAGYQQGVYRICLDTVFQHNAIAGADFWFDEHNRRWNGPHTFAYDCVSAIQDFFVLSSKNVPGVLFASYPTPHVASTYLDDGATYFCHMVSGLMPNRNDMAMYCIQENTLEAGKSAQASDYVVTALDDNDVILGSVSILTSTAGIYLWDNHNWDQGLWNSASYVSGIVQLNWAEPIIFKRMKLDVYGQAKSGTAIGQFEMRYQTLNYLMPTAA